MVSRLCPLSGGPSDDSFQLTLLSLFGAPAPWCPGQLPQLPTPRSTTVYRKQLAKIKVAGTLSDWFRVKKGVTRLCPFPVLVQ